MLDACVCCLDSSQQPQKAGAAALALLMKKLKLKGEVTEPRKDNPAHEGLDHQFRSLPMTCPREIPPISPLVSV